MTLIPLREVHRVREKKQISLISLTLNHAAVLKERSIPKKFASFFADFLHLSNPGLNLVNVSSIRHASSCVKKPVVQYGAGFYSCM